MNPRSVGMEVTSGGHRIAYEVEGDGPTIVLASGVYQAASDWTRCGYVDALSRDHRIIAVDPLGFGRSDKPHDPAAYGFDSRVDHLLAVLDAEEVERAVMWGYSFGGMQVEAFAQREPSRVEALVMGGTLAGLSSADRRNIFEPDVETLRSGEWEVLFATTAAGSFPDDMRAELQRRNDLLAIAASHEGTWLPFSAEGREVDSRVLNYVGSLESWFSVAFAIAEAMGLDFEAIDDAEHGLAFRDVEAVLAVVKPFLDGRSDESGSATDSLRS
jgi:pimeloyl-ACP methyl ester carboxylesterase